MIISCKCINKFLWLVSAAVFRSRYNKVCIPSIYINLALIKLAMRLSACVCKSTPIMADVTVTKIAGYVRVCILMNQ